LHEILRIVIIDRVINTLLGGLTLDPAGMHCPSWDDAFVSSLFFGHAPSPEHCAFEWCIVRTSIALPFIGRFRRGFQLFQKGLLFQMHYIFLIIIARSRHNFREIAVKNCEKSKNRWKSLCAPLRIQGG